MSLCADIYSHVQQSPYGYTTPHGGAIARDQEGGDRKPKCVLAKFWEAL